MDKHDTINIPAARSPTAFQLSLFPIEANTGFKEEANSIPLACAAITNSGTETVTMRKQNNTL